MDQAEDAIRNYQGGVDRNLDKAESRFKAYGRQVAATMSRVKSQVGGAVSRLGSLQGAMAGLAAGYGMSRFVQLGADFERSLSMVEVTAQATGEQMDELRQSARKMGETTEFSATQAAEAQRFLSMAGLEVNETLETLPQMLNLATAAELDLARAADISTNVMSQFGLEVKELTEVNDALVGVQATANTSVEEAANALTYAGAKAKTFNMSVEETVGLIGMLANNGIKASKAGTTLRQGMQKLLNPTGDAADLLKRYNIEVKNGEGGMRSFVEVLKDMADAGMTASDAANLLGARAGNLTLLMDQGSQGIEQYLNRMRSMEGRAKSVAQTVRQDMQGAIDKLTSRLESVALTVWERYSQKIQNTTERAAKWIGDHGTEIADFVDRTVTKAKELGKDVVPMLKGMKDAMAGILSVFNSLPSDLVSAGGVGIVGAMLFGPKVGVIVTALVYADKKLGDIHGKLKNLTGLDIESKEHQIGNLGKQLQDLWDVLSGKRDPNTGEIIPEKPFKVAQDQMGIFRTDVETTDNKLKQFQQRTRQMGLESLGLDIKSLAEYQNSLDTAQEQANESAKKQSTTINKQARIATQNALSLESLAKRQKDLTTSYQDIAVRGKEGVEKAQRTRAMAPPGLGPGAVKEAEKTKNRLSVIYEDIKNMSTFDQLKRGSASAWESMRQDATNWAANTKQVMSQTFNRMSGMLTDFVMTGKFKWQEMTQAILKMITKMMIKWMAFQALKAAGMGFSSGGIPGFASGGAIGGGGKGFMGVQQFARGGVLTEPTIFPMQKGGLGMAGEAGYEGILPLTRTKSGDLGVKAEGEGGGGGGANVTNIIKAETGPDGKIAKESMNQMIRKVGRATSNAVMRGSRS